MQLLSGPLVSSGAFPLECLEGGHKNRGLSGMAGCNDCNVAPWTSYSVVWTTCPDRQHLDWVIMGIVKRLIAKGFGDLPNDRFPWNSPTEVNL